MLLYLVDVVNLRIGQHSRLPKDLTKMGTEYTDDVTWAVHPKSDTPLATDSIITLL